MKKIFLPLVLIALTSVFKLANAQFITVTTGSTQNVTCNGSRDGAININVSGYYPPYTFSWSNGDYTQNISGLAAQTYSLVVTDYYGYTQSYSNTITQPNAFAATFITVGDTGTGSNHSGTAKPQITGGTPPYAYFWSTTETTDSISGLANGSYSLTVTDSKACISQAFDFSVGLALGIQNVNGKSHFTIYPNPATDYLSVNITSSSIKEVEVTDILGHAIYAEPATGNQLTIDISHLAPGVYFAVLKTMNGSSADVKKFIKE